MKIIILAGGGGSRLFPLSRKSYPKQFLCLEDDCSLLAHTVKRFLSFVAAKDIIIITNQKYLYHVQNELRECDAEAAHVLLEPVARNTASAIALGVEFFRSQLDGKETEVLLVAAADHVIRPLDKFKHCVESAEQAAKAGRLVTFGIPAKRPETGYGYIEAVDSVDVAMKVTSFKEKPDFATAQKYVADGNYYWNSGMFAFSLKTIKDEFATFMPEVAQQMDKGYKHMLANFNDLPDISIDYAVVEQSKNVCMVELPCYWNDIGSWDAMYDILPKDDNGNAVKGDVLALDCKNSLIMGRDRLIAGIGFDDLLLVETDDVIVVAKKGESQKVKNVVEKLKAMHRKEAVEHTTIFHEWGTSAVIGQGKGYRMKKVRVMPGKSLALQMHYHRTEHWVVLRGTAEVVRGNEHMFIHEEESVFIPQTVKHQLSNPGRIPLELIEIQNGAYISEDDIVRFKE
ncbi:mannose-1-phosphate guanylyltransferase/mannose-6-phosphate isomerase [Selenomonas ruminantium]|uniref:mannose-1-phosphate guanylyltransferase n=1 Tax=Selenomonas ruminantium TaxID=971 RepID=A0A1H0VA80_SELRU|nr:mannose-1-phosphate guanylyltransferase/mannose-6-phosphate isomerase [Selenomonas ruminantium]SDP75273.1 mannose-1-phosphate guanylyltransferase / mannose-6-phosphate isomerase [Selenomonas ruminantium]